MALLTTLGMITGGAGAVKQFIDGGKMAAEASHGLAKLREPQLTNLAENLKPSFAIEQKMLENLEKQRAGFVDVSQGMDAAQAMAFMAQGEGMISDKETGFLNQMMEKEYQADLVRVQEEQRMREIEENRYMEKLQSLRAQAQAGKEMQSAAIMDVASMAVSAGTAQDAAMAEAGQTDPKAARLSKRAGKFASADDITAAYKSGGTSGLKDIIQQGRQARRDAGMGFLGENTKVGGFFRGIGSNIGQFFGDLFK